MLLAQKVSLTCASRADGHELTGSYGDVREVLVVFQHVAEVEALDLVGLDFVGVEVLPVASEDSLLPLHDELCIVDREIWQENALDFLSFLCTLDVVDLVLDCRAL